jgi:hypothetical protein
VVVTITDHGANLVPNTIGPDPFCLVNLRDVQTISGTSMKGVAIAVAVFHALKIG